MSRLQRSHKKSSQKKSLKTRKRSTNKPSRKSPKQKNSKRKSKRKSTSVRPLKVKYCSKSLNAAGKCKVLKAVIINYTYNKNGFKRIVSKSFYFKTAKERNAYILYLKDKYPTINKIEKYDTRPPVSIRK